MKKVCHLKTRIIFRFPMRASGPTARTALSIEQLLRHARDVLGTSLRFLHDRRPTNPLIARERRKVVPSFERVEVGVQRGSHIGGNCMDDAGRNYLFSHGEKPVVASMIRRSSAKTKAREADLTTGDATLHP